MILLRVRFLVVLKAVKAKYLKVIIAKAYGNGIGLLHELGLNRSSTKALVQ